MNAYKAEQQKWKGLSYDLKDYEIDGSAWWEDSGLVDFSSEEGLASKKVAIDGLSKSSPVFGLDGYQGFYYMPGYLAKESRDMLAWLCLTEYCEPPHDTNIAQVPMKAHENESCILSMWAKYVGGMDCTNHYNRLGKLAWSTMGYNYDWTLRAYHEGKRSPFPRVLEDLSQRIASVVDHDVYNPQASIVNFYHTKSLMGGHQDDLELTFDKPVVSMSFGLPGIFLLGGLTKNEKPTPILVRDGDCMVMGGGSRLRFHGLAKVLGKDVRLPESVRGEGRRVDLEEEEMPRFQEERVQVWRFLESHRININVRQVLPDGCDSIGDV